MQPLWQVVWRNGIAPQMSVSELEVLASALRTNDPALVQEATTLPAMLDYYDTTKVHAGDAIALMLWRGRNIDRVGEVNQAWDRLIDVCNQELKRISATSNANDFLNWFDWTRREQMVPALLAEVKLTLASRQQVA